MRKAFLLLSVLIGFACNASAQELMTVEKNDGKKITIPVRDIAKVTFGTDESNIEDEYYLIGFVNNWDISNTDYKFTRVDDYANFTITIPANSDTYSGDKYFKIVPGSVIGTSNWDKLLGCEVDGDTSLEGNLTDENAGAMKMPTFAGATTYTIDINMKEKTYKISSDSNTGTFSDCIYLPGDANGWTFSDKLKGDGQGIYKGYAVLGGRWGWKVTQYPDWEHGDYGNGGEGILAEGGGNIMESTDPKQYYAEINLANMTYRLTEITSISIIGSVNGSWDIDTDMTLNLESRCWSVTTDLKKGEFKFRANHNWELNLGGEPTALYGDGQNLQIEEDGNYTITLYLASDYESHYTITRN